MTSQEWLAYLTTPEAHISQHGILDYGDPFTELQTTQTQNILCDLSQLGTLEINGDDASTFLQGQLTNDIRLVDDHHAQISGYCNPKGRLLALFTITGKNNHYQLLMPHTILPSIQKRLSMFVLRSKVKITDITETTFILGLHGIEAEKILSNILEQIPQIPFETVISDNTRVIRLPTSNAPRFLIIVDGHHVQSIWERLKQDCHIVGKSCWDYLDIHAGLPTIVKETQEAFVPQMLNLDILNGINFKKGCYTGQEIVARTHYLGNIKRRTFLATLHHQNAPAPGSNVTDSQNNPVGQVVSAVPSLKGVDMLVELRLEAAQSGALFYESFPMELRELPYSLDKAGG